MRQSEPKSKTNNPLESLKQQQLKYNELKKKIKSWYSSDTSEIIFCRVIVYSNEFGKPVDNWLSGRSFVHDFMILNV